MAKISFLICFVFALVAVMEVESATHQAPAPSVDCSTLVLTMADCLSFVTNGSTLKKPEGGCCKGLKNVLKTDAECLCETFKSSSQLGIVLDIAKAATLPAACNVKAPSISNCALSVTPSAAPGLSPSMSPANAPGSSDTTGGAITPALAPASSGAVVSPVSFVALVVLFVASCLHF